MSEALILKVLGIKCDAPGCDFKDTSVQRRQYYEWINRPCPKCGANLLTEADYKLCCSIEAATALINAAFGPMPEDIKQRPRYRLKMNGTETFTIEPPK